ncbi:MAG TPA: ATP-dependent Clp protease adaptor ClpS [Fimbriimonadaceae bacterium]|nr:ATP-dependent Clp protease adaptor ClpS [Fimbriimonadaceae bacterium]
MAHPTILPVIEPDAGSKGHGGWTVTVFNNDVNTYDEVMVILVAATGCTFEEAAIETWEIDHLGKSVVHFGQATECESVAAIISTIGIRVEVREE